MNAELQHVITQRLIAEFGMKPSGDGTKLKSGECPHCHQKELWAFAESPWVVRCNRLNKCGYEEHVKNLYDDLFNTWSDRHPPTPSNPNAAADAYISVARGFDLAKIKGWYYQASYYDHQKKIGSATVRIDLPGVGYFERIIDQPWRFGNRKATIHGSYKGQWWIPPGLDLTKVQELWIVEGIFDCIALNLSGIPSATSLCANHYPATALDALKGLTIDSGRPTLVWALDGDKAGRQYTKAWTKRAQADGWPCEAASIPQGRGGKLDWNDLYQRDRLAAEHLTEYRYRGALLIAPNVQEKARLIYQKKGWNSFHLDYKNRLYWFALNLAEYQKILDRLAKEQGAAADKAGQEAEALKQAGHAYEIANCHPIPLYHLWSRKTEDVFFYFKIVLPDEDEVKMTFSNGQLYSAPEFGKRLLAARSIWSGTQKQLLRILPFWTEGIKSVETVDHVGYVPEHGCYVLTGIAVKNGKIHTLNDEDFYVLDKRLAIKPAQDLMPFHPSTAKDQYHTDWVKTLTIAFGDRGLVMLAFWLGSVFSCQIIKHHKAWPFISLTGDPGTGKSTLVMFFWKLLGVHSSGGGDYEGFDPAKASPSAFRRAMGQSSYPVVFTEADRDPGTGAGGRPAKQFDWDILKPAVNHGSIGLRAIKDNTNKLKDIDFLGSIVVVQNADISASEAMQERFINLVFSKFDLNDASNRAAEYLEHLEAEIISYWHTDALLKEREILALYLDRYPVHYANLGESQGIRNYRVRQFHAQIQALLDCLPLLVPIAEDALISAQICVNRLAKTKEISLGKDHPVIEELWALFDYLEGSGDHRVNHSGDDRYIAINLNDLEAKAALARQRIPPLSEIKRLLKDSRLHKFVTGAENPRVIHSPLRAEQNRRQEFAPVEQRNLLAEKLRCWIFEK